jgi:hypothetical protein
MRLTSCPVNTRMKETISRIIEIYLTRWKCDESFRYIKQCHNLEDIRVRIYISIPNTVALILAFLTLRQSIWGTTCGSKVLLRGSIWSRRDSLAFLHSLIMPSPTVSIRFSSPTRPVCRPQQKRQNFN